MFCTTFYGVYKYIYCYGNGPYWTTKYRISSDPPLNACIVRLFGKMDVICVSEGVRGCIIVVRWWWNENSLFFFPGPDEAPPSRLRVWPKRGSDAKGKSLSASPREGVIV